MHAIFTAVAQCIQSFTIIQFGDAIDQDRTRVCESKSMGIQDQQLCSTLDWGLPQGHSNAIKEIVYIPPLHPSQCFSM
jgi:hypothetical protein